MPLDAKKYKKKDLVRIIDEYEDLIDTLNNELENNSREKIIILNKKEDDKHIAYIKKRLLVIKNKMDREIYEKELKRLLSNYD